MIECCDLHDIKIQSRSFTCYRSNGARKRRIDRAIVNNKWLDRWQSCTLRGFRDLSRIIVLSFWTPNKWIGGPKPFRFINAWATHPDFMGVVENSWKEEGLRGWGCYIFLEKLKRLKSALKSWNANTFGLMDSSIASLRDEIHNLDLVDDVFGLKEEEARKRSEATANLIWQLHNSKSLLAQKAKFRWLVEGDVNSKLFHKSIIARHRKNGLAGIEIDGAWVEDPRRIKDFIRNHFRCHFQRRIGLRARLDSDFEGGFGEDFHG